MDKRFACRELRKQMNICGWVVLIYYGLVNVMVTALLVAEIFGYALKGVELSEEQLTQLLLDNGWGYLVAALVGGVLLVLWKKKSFCFREIWQSERTMTFGGFFVLLCLFLGGQGLSQLVNWGLEFLLNLVGLSGIEALEAASLTPNTLSMFLYVGLVAPIAEEILFRGVLLRILMPYGKRLAILGTAFLFGIYHGNLMQSPYAFAVGLVLGYVAVEYSMGWAMVLHMINNLILGDTVIRLLQLLHPWWGDLIFGVIIWGTLAAGLVFLLCYRRKISAYIRENPMQQWAVQSFFTAPGIWLFAMLMIMSMVMSVTIL